jgi:hypothetical protein
VSSETTRIKAPVPPRPRSSLGWKKIVPIVLVVLIVGCLVLIVAASWPLTPISSSTSASTSTAADKEEVLKAKLETYSKRADDLEKLASLLVGLSTVYAIALAVSAYTSVQGNNEQAKRLVDEAKESVTKLEELSKEFETLKNTEIQNLRKEIESARNKANYATRMAIATMVSDYPPTPEGIDFLRKDTIERLKELRSSEYANDRFVNLQLARLYSATNQHQESEDALTTFIARAEKADEKDESAIASAYYDRACYQSLRWDQASDEEKEFLTDGIKRDLKRAFELDAACRREARRPDPDFRNVYDLTWFKELLRI